MLYPRKSMTLFLAIILVLATASASVSQTPGPATTQNPVSASLEKVTQIDQLLKECGELTRKGNNTEVARKAKDALKLSQALGDRYRIAQSFGYLGSSNFYLGRLQEAVDYHQQAAAFAQAAGNKRFYGASLHNMGATLSALGRYEEALFYLQKSVEIGKELNAGIALWWPLHNIGDLYGHLGEIDKAETTLLEALALARQFKNKLLEEATLSTLIGVPAARKQYQAALEYCNQAAAIDAEVKREGSDPRYSGLHYELLNNTAYVYQAMGDYQKAIEMYREAIVTARTLNIPLGEAVITSNIGECQRNLGQLSAALDSQMRARDIIRKMGEYAYPVDATTIDRRLALVKEALGQDEEALKIFNDALDKTERVRAGAVRTESSKAGISGALRDLFFDAIQLLLKENRGSDAFEVAERYRARAFLDMLAEARIDLRQNLTPAQRQSEDVLFDRISAIQKELLKEGVSPERQQQLGTELTAAENDLEAFHLALRRENPRYASVQHPEPLSVERVQGELLDADTVLVEYLLGEKNSLAWVVSQKKVTVVELPPRKEIEEQVSRYQQMLTRRVSALTVQRDLEDYRIASQKLYATLIRPFEGSISASRKLLIVPDGVLAYLPFETLAKASVDRSTGKSLKSQSSQLLLERFAISYIPSASALAAIKLRGHEPIFQKKSLLAFGDPVYERPGQKTTGAASGANGASSSLSPASFTRGSYAERGFDFTQLPNTRIEVLAISSLFPVGQKEVYLGADAREEAVKSENLEQYRYLHFAAHALIDDKFPSRSGIVLSLGNDSKEDGVLQMNEIMRLNVNASLVTLSACSTALGKLYDGEGIVGLTRAFLYAGADSVVVSLWNINDNATAELMKDFYKNLSREMSKDDALRQAKLAMLRSRGEWRHPYFWAPFVLIGQR